jgi:L-ascorbate metabolism protein UlaG (beta-lactamase superfamily)
MRIAKYVHSCVLLEEAGERLLFDPGRFSFVEGRVSPDQFGDVSAIVLTHNHPDHIDVQALRRILELSNAEVIANGEVASVLQPEGVAVRRLDEGTIQAGAFSLRAIPTPHEPILASTLPRHTSFVVNNRVLNTVDSFDPVLEEFAGIDLLIMPVMAPFLTEVGAVAFAQRMRPQAVFPVHDGYARDFFLTMRYDAYASSLANLGINFHRVTEPGASITI